jgi:hypothetical protein
MIGSEYSIYGSGFHGGSMFMSGASVYYRITPGIIPA